MSSEAVRAESLDRISTRRELHAPFANWHFRDFSGFDVSREKPHATGSQAIHDATGTAGDDSLFSWVVEASMPSTPSVRVTLMSSLSTPGSSAEIS